MKNTNKKIFSIFAIILFFISFKPVFSQNSSSVEIQAAPSYYYSSTGQYLGTDINVTQQNLDPNRDISDVVNFQSAINNSDLNFNNSLNNSNTSFNNSLTDSNTTFKNSAATNPNSGVLCSLPTRPTFKTLIKYGVCIMSRFIVPVMFLLAIVIFVWGVVQYVINTNDEAKKKSGRSFMIWGIVSLSVMVSVWGLVAIVGRTFGVNTSIIPQLNTGAQDTNTNTGNTNNTAPPQVTPSFNDSIQTIPTLPASQIIPSGSQ
jgi:hypothetical protein